MRDFSPHNAISYVDSNGRSSTGTIMNQKEILARLTPILEDTFDATNYEFTLDTARDDIEEWDSLAQVRLFLAVEMDFGFKFDLDDMENIDGISDLIDIISAKPSS